MSIKTGIVNLNWNQVNGADGYQIQVIGDELFYKNFLIEGSSNNSIQVSGVDPGVEYYAKVYYYSGFNTSTSYQISNTGVSLPQNFHSTKGKTFEFNSFILNSKNLEFSQSNDGIYRATGNYYSSGLNLKYTLINPRDDTVLQDPAIEPFFSGTKYSKYLSSPSVYNTVDDADLFFSYEKTSRNFKLQVEAIDYYQSGITGEIDLIGTPVKVQKLKLKTISGNNNASGLLQISPTFSFPPKKSEFFLSANNFYPHGYNIGSGVTNGFDRISIGAPYSTGLYLRIIPSDYFGTGSNYYRSDIYLANEDYDASNKIQFFDISELGGFQHFANFSYVKNSKFNSYLEVSVDPTITGKFNSHSYFTGRFHDSTGHKFNPNLYDARTGLGETLYGNLNLYSSGDGSLQDSKQISFVVPYPKIVGSNVHYNYVDGLTTFNFLSNFDSSRENIRYQISGHGDDKSFFTGLDITSLTTGERVSTLNVKLERETDGYIYDELDIIASGQLPRIGVNMQGSATTLDGQASIQFTNLRPIPVNYIQISAKPAFVVDYTATGAGGPTGVPSSGFNNLLSGIENFNDFNDFIVNGDRRATIGLYVQPAPQGASSNEIYTALNESGAPFSYESGSHYVYKFVPINGYGSGIESDPIFHNFTANSLFTAQTEAVINNTTEISNTVENVYNIQNTYTVFSGQKEFRGDVLFSPQDKCSGIEFDGNITISGFTGLNCDRLALNVYGNSILSGDACVGTGKDIAFEVTDSKSQFFNNVEIRNNKSLLIDRNLNVSGNIKISGYNVTKWTTSIPATPTSAGSQGTFAFSATGIYICVANNSWRVIPAYLF